MPRMSWQNQELTRHKPRKPTFLSKSFGTQVLPIPGFSALRSFPMNSKLAPYGGLESLSSFARHLRDGERWVFLGPSLAFPWLLVLLLPGISRIDLPRRGTRSARSLRLVGRFFRGFFWESPCYELVKPEEVLGYLFCEGDRGKLRQQSCIRLHFRTSCRSMRMSRGFLSCREAGVVS